MPSSLRRLSFLCVSIACVSVGATAAQAQQSADPDASPGGVLPVPYIVPRTETVEPVSRADTKHFKGSYMRKKAAERDTLMVLANAVPVAPSTATTQAATTAFAPRRVPVVAPAPSAPIAPPAASRTSAPMAYTAPTDVGSGAAHETPTEAASPTAAPSTPSDLAVEQAPTSVPNDVPDTTSTVSDSTGEYFIIRPVLEGTMLRRSTADRLVGLASAYAKRSLDVTYIIAVEAAPNDDAATDALLSTADHLRRELIDAGAPADRVIVRDAPPTGPRSALRILLRGPRTTVVQPARARRHGTTATVTTAL